jgi:hypothetical protein
MAVEILKGPIEAQYWSKNNEKISPAVDTVPVAMPCSIAIPTMVLSMMNWFYFYRARIMLSSSLTPRQNLTPMVLRNDFTVGKLAP